jgi:hypothetical protein
MEFQLVLEQSEQGEIHLTKGEIVWLTDRFPGRWAALVSRGTYYSTVVWAEEGVEYEDTIENTDYEFLEDRAIEFEPDSD